MSMNSTYNFSDFLDDSCSTICTNMSTAITALRIILHLPLSTLIIYLGFQQWQQRRSFKTASHSDIFTYHTAAMELIWVLGCLLTFCGTYTMSSALLKAGFYTTKTGLYGETLLHVLTCVERYLAVVHPITYLGLRNAHGIRIRNISIGCVWLLVFGLIGVTVVFTPNYATIPLFCILVFSIIIMPFCSFSILCILIRSGPGEGSGEKERLDQTKSRAFHMIAVITGMLWLWFVGLLVFTILAKLSLLTDNPSCVVGTSASWFNLPSSLVLPLLYLHRTGKLLCLKQAKTRPGLEYVRSAE